MNEMKEPFTNLLPPDSSQKNNFSLEQLAMQVKLAQAGLRLLFRYDGDFFEPRREFLNMERAKFVRILNQALLLILHELECGEPALQERLHLVCSDQVDAVDALNELADCGEGDDFAQKCENAIFDALQMRGVNFAQLTAEELPAEVDYYLTHAVRVAQTVEIFRCYVALLTRNSSLPGAGRLRPKVYRQLENNSMLSSWNFPAELSKIQQRALECDPFSRGRAFRWRSGHFFLADSEKIRPWPEFFGYEGVRNKFERFFAEFASGVNNLPLLICGLPGQGKTHLSISAALQHHNLTLIMPEPENLEENLAELIQFLKSRPTHKFVIFFDDIEPERINWYYFRTNVGGSMTLPGNVCIVIASNYEFPVNIVSRGYGIKFPIFDEIRCCEMIADYLTQHGMRRGNTDRLCSVMAADYLEEFAQRRFDELSPRTLVRYLDIFDRDRNRRIKMVEASRNELITRPDPQMFFEFNLRIMKSLYGQDYLDEMLRERLKSLES
ncbi:MAG: DUF815 domain-containing protein [Victivallaceae bacterium]